MKRQKNLNTTALMKGGQKRRTHSDFYFRSDGIKIVGKENDVRECIECHIAFPVTAFTTRGLRGDRAYYLQSRCRDCSAETQFEKRQVRKNAPPKPNHCNCCHQQTKKLEIDHLHGSTTFRGWLCGNCNKGMGHMGDNLEGVLRSAMYLEKDTNKIIETLNGIKNEKKF